MAPRPFVEEPKGSVANYPYFERGKDSTMAYLYRLFQERIVMFDGAMGTMIQKFKLGEEEYRGERFKVGLGWVGGIRRYVVCLMCGSIRCVSIMNSGTRDSIESYHIIRTTLV